MAVRKLLKLASSFLVAGMLLGGLAAIFFDGGSELRVISSFRQQFPRLIPISLDDRIEILEDGTKGKRRVPNNSKNLVLLTESDSAISTNHGKILNVSDLAGEGKEKPLKRVCGSPAVDAYAHVNPQCLVDSPTAVAWRNLGTKGRKSGPNLACNKEVAVSLDGLAVAWGPYNKKTSPEECCQACRDHVPGHHVGGPYQDLPCNVWVFCPDEVCFEADIHKHTKGDCWLKFSEAPQNPEVNSRGRYSPEFRLRHPKAPEVCQWISGVLVPPGQVLTNGTLGPRAWW